MEGLTGDVNKETVMAQMQAATDVETFGSGGQTFTCDGSAIPMMPDICSASSNVGTLTADGQVEDAETVDPTSLFEA
jgi:branched-chain amino acid transport system substrate-binding protein